MINTTIKQAHKKRNPNLNQHASLRTVHMCAYIVHNCRMEHSIGQF